MSNLESKRFAILFSGLALALAAAASLEAQTVLYTSPLASSFANTGGYCSAVNVSDRTHDVTVEIFDAVGDLVGTAYGLLEPNTVTGVPSPNGIGSVYCKITVQDVDKRGDSLKAVRGSLCLKEDEIVGDTFYSRCIAVVEAR